MVVTFFLCEIVEFMPDYVINSVGLLGDFSYSTQTNIIKKKKNEKITIWYSISSSYIKLC